MPDTVTHQEQITATQEAEPYVRVSKIWSRNSGFAERSWLYYVDLVNKYGESSKSLGMQTHSTGMADYGMMSREAEVVAQNLATFFGWPIRHFEEERRTDVKMKEVTHPLRRGQDMKTT